MLLDICVCVLVFIVGFNIKHLFSNLNAVDKRMLNKLFLWHFLIAVLFHFYIELNGGDAQYYWSSVKVDSLTEIWSYVSRGSATGVIQLINYFPSRVLDLSFFTGNMLYALLGFVGFVLLYQIIKHFFNDVQTLMTLTIGKIPLFPWLLFLPNLHFWSSGIGKDTVLFFCILLFVYALINPRRRFVPLGLVVGLSLLIRPHITLFLIASFGLGFLIDGKLPGYQKMFISLIFLAGFVSIFNYVLEFVQLESFETGAIEEYATKKATSLNQERSGSGVDMSGYPFPFKVFTFLYRPLFFDINGLLAVLASFENLVLFILTVRMLRSKFIFNLRKASVLIKGMVIYFLLGTVAFSLILGNLGIMLRQKNQFFPLFIVIVLYMLYTHSVNINENTTKTDV